jgi:predicted nucleic acid-binding protein
VDAALRRNAAEAGTSLNEVLLRALAKEAGLASGENDEDTTYHYARLFRQLRIQGTPIPTNDIWLAALVVQHNLRLFARDRHFDALPQLSRV